MRNEDRPSNRGQVEPVKEKPVPGKLDRVSSLIERVQTSVKRLSERLEPAMSPTGATEAVREETPMTSQSVIADKLDRFADDLLSIEAYLDTIIDRLEI